ncbi:MULTISPECIES: hypothetical protein [Streptomyces]|uniref:Uncharacterized protein n=1 Tax=Streptomyces violaceolatus TaxID=67378 RepID=A0ABN3THP0_9ACTN|nr:MULTISPECIES: hypothetical protein [Streptomyces]MBQ0953798.1 hypothetical protein [Streptomyces sp. RK76]REH18349.1 hypothetical protein BX268_0033 [Streptomyces sp. 2221.1]WTE23793.1 hypothetical protein OH747_39840 [Streptomyces anthocyanicus]SDS20135.1 hypothetical protein SAMN05428941_0037 [Streptomyces sp. 2114.2]GGL76129.1 hypothetical protein GCM10010095_71480 [Streptomyces anthocyanicus]
MKDTAARTRRAVLTVTTRLKEGLAELQRRPDRGDISITTAIIWIAVVTAALTVAGTIAVVIAKYNGNLSGI